MYSNQPIETLEDRRLFAAVAVTVNFQPGGAATPSGTVADTGAVYAARNGYTYGWDKSVAGTTRDRNASNAPDQSHDTFAQMNGTAGARKWEISLPNGKYTVRVVAGDASFNVNPTIKAEGTTVVSGSTTAGARWLDATKTITVSDGRLTLTGGGSGVNPIDFVRITTAGTSTGGGTTTSGAWPSTSAWKSAASSPIARFESHAFSYGGKLYVMGGWADSSFNSTKRVDVYNPATNSWTRLKDMQAPETHAGAALDEAHGVMYFVGGHRGKYPSTPSKEVWKYTIATDSWVKLNVTLPYAMGANNVQIVNGKLYSFGGNYADRVTNTSDVFKLDLSNLSAGFSKVASMPSARDHLSSVAIGKYIYAFGGEFMHDVGHDQQRILQRYDTTTNTWTRLADMPGAKSHAESSTFLWNGKIIYAGGQTDTTTKQQPTSSVYSYDPSTNKWTTLASLPYARQGTVVQKVGNYLVFTTGGIQTSQPQKATWVVKLA